ncbi:MAG: hypothetical protein QM749_01655 [Aquabacterium sp.]
MSRFFSDLLSAVGKVPYIRQIRNFLKEAESRPLDKDRYSRVFDVAFIEGVLKISRQESEDFLEILVALDIATVDYKNPAVFEMTLMSEMNAQTYDLLFQKAEKKGFPVA